jgi:hypothetical protein
MICLRIRRSTAIALVLHLDAAREGTAQESFEEARSRLWSAEWLLREALGGDWKKCPWRTERAGSRDGEKP